MSTALQTGEEDVKKLLDKYPDLVNEVTTGGATPLHMCGMSKRAELMTEFIISRGGNTEAFDTYGFQPLHRMASNNLAVGADALLRASVPASATTKHGETAMQIALDSHAIDVVCVLRNYS